MANPIWVEAPFIIKRKCIHFIHKTAYLRKENMPSCRTRTSGTTSWKLTSTLQLTKPFQQKTQRCKPVPTLLVFPWQRFRRSPFLSSVHRVYRNNQIFILFYFITTEQAAWIGTNFQKFLSWSELVFRILRSIFCQNTYPIRLLICILRRPICQNIYPLRLYSGFLEAHFTRTFLFYVPFPLRT